MKKILSALLALLFLALSAVPAAAEEAVDYNRLETAIGISYYFLYVPDETSDTTKFSMLHYNSLDDREAYIPKTLLDVELTPEIFNGSNIYLNVPPLATDDDNAYYTVRDGALYTKDGKTLLFVPHSFIYGRHAPDEDLVWRGGMYTIPDGTQQLAEWSVPTDTGACVIIPDSVTQISPDCGIYGSIAASPGSAAQAYARAHGNAFIPLGETHTHTYFRLVNDANCTRAGSVTVQCPCGKVAFTQTTDPEPDAHWFGQCIDRQTGERTRCCIACGMARPSAAAPEADCGCACHTISRTVLPSLNNGFLTTLRNCIFRLRLLVWRLTGTHQYCECGARHY